ncbi:protein RKD5-like isoform X2 [Phoenix dactylifera]|uniref:Protein RKD5-like isoform X2 n=1 Tax=Phoenix dactylifera TaxID=42345 RepID=A0A8B7D501_PHODC|nr:protein RKD5-like isoform X2 [Phoenix dactylifera]
MTHEHPPSTSMDSSSSSSSSNNHHPHPPPSLLSFLAVFKNVLNQELIRSVHAYRIVPEEEGEGRELWVEREFLFSPTSHLEITAPIPRQLLLADPVVGGGVRHRPRFHEGQNIGLWLCILAFDSATAAAISRPPPIPPILSFSRNPRLQSVPTLSCDLQKVFELRCETENQELMHVVSEEILADKDNKFSRPMKNAPDYDEDQLSHSGPMMKQATSDNQHSHEIVPEVGASMKKKRAAAEHVASISLTDLVKYFNLPIIEASRNLNVGLTVLKRKCREFGIPRWPHRKMKSLDTLGTQSPGRDS